MLISDLAMRELQWQRDSISTSFAVVFARLVRPLSTLGRRGSLPPSPLCQSVPDTPKAYGGLTLIAGDARPPSAQLKHRLFTQPVILATSPHHAHLAAVRGLFNARSGDYEGARLAFAEAARDHAEDLTALPGFWSLARAGQTAAVLAYEDAGRPDDAADLAARLRASLRPGSHTPRSAGDTAPRMERRQAALGG